jgi:hypothetical protein
MYEMRSRGIIATIIVFVSIPFIFTCSEEKTASIEGHEDIVAVLQKLPECYENPKTIMEIYAEDAVLKRQDRRTGLWNEFKGLKEIGDYKKEKGKGIHEITLSIHSIKKEADKAQVEYNLIIQVAEDHFFYYEQRCSAEMVKKGQAWKIKENRVGY